MTLLAGTRLGPYEVVDLLGAGGMGEVYRARDPESATGWSIELGAFPGWRDMPEW